MFYPPTANDYSGYYDNFSNVNQTVYFDAQGHGYVMHPQMNTYEPYMVYDPYLYYPPAPAPAPVPVPVASTTKRRDEQD